MEQDGKDLAHDFATRLEEAHGIEEADELAALLSQLAQAREQTELMCVEEDGHESQPAGEGDREGDGE